MNKGRKEGKNEGRQRKKICMVLLSRGTDMKHHFFQSLFATMCCEICPRFSPLTTSWTINSNQSSLNESQS